MFSSFLDQTEILPGNNIQYNDFLRFVRFLKQIFPAIKTSIELINMNQCSFVIVQRLHLQIRYQLCRLISTRMYGTVLNCLLSSQVPNLACFSGIFNAFFYAGLDPGNTCNSSKFSLKSFTYRESQPGNYTIPVNTRCNRNTPHYIS